MSGMHFCQLTDLFKKQEIRMDPGNEKKKKIQWMFYKYQTHLWPQTAAWNTEDIICSQVSLSSIPLFWLLAGQIQ